MNLPRFSVKNHVAINIFMMLIILGGIYNWNVMLREFFPNFSLEQFIITTPFPSASPEEIEKSVTFKIEREIQGVDGIENISSNVFEGVSIINITLISGVDKDSVLDELRAKVDQVKSELPDDAEDTVITELKPTLPVVSVMVYGDVSEEVIRKEALAVKDDLQSFPEISRIFIAGIRNQEIHVEVRPESLEKYSLTFEDVGRKIAAINLDIPGGQLKGSSYIGVRTIGESKKASEVEDFIILSKEDGTIVRLKDIATVKNDFEDKIEKGRFAGKNACMVTVLKTPSQDALKIAAIVKKYIADNQSRLSGAVSLDMINDLSRFIEQRLDLMVRSATSGFILVLIALIFFMDLKTAFWVALGLIVSFLGTFVIMDLMGITINLMSLFALILVLGLVVDDAIIVSENIYAHIRKGDKSPEDAAVAGANEVSIPVIAAVSTSIIAFLPMLFLDKEMGAFLGELPKVMIAALSVSLIESFLILPAHLTYKEKEEKPPKNIFTQTWFKIQFHKNYFFEEYLPTKVGNFVGFCLYWRYATISISIGFSFLVLGLVASDIVPFVFLQKVDAEIINIDLEMASGTPEEVTTQMIKRIEQVALAVEEVDDVFAVTGTAFSDRGRKTPDDPATIGQLTIELVSADIREDKKMRTSQQVIADMRTTLGEIPGAKSLLFIEMAGGPQGADIEIRVEGKSFEQISQAVSYVTELIGHNEGVMQVSDTLKKGKQELRIKLLDTAYISGITTASLALQVRHALFGFEAQKLQDNDEEIIVRVLLPKNERANIRDLYALKIATPSGARIPLEELAEITITRGYSSISRYDGKRVANIRADVDEDKVNISSLTDKLEKNLENISDKFPGITISFEGQRKQTSDSLGALAVGFPVALFVIYAIIAGLFNSYIQPFIIMIAIPYAIIGAILGHFIMQMPFTLLSMIGCVALAGVVVNDSLVLVSFVNQVRGATETLTEALTLAVRRRLRAILLTTITTVFGLIPLMLERSFQAQFLIPMAISLVFGLIFATVITLLIIPVLYLILEDIKQLFIKTWQLL